MKNSCSSFWKCSHTTNNNFWECFTQILRNIQLNLFENVENENKPKNLGVSVWLGGWIPVLCTAYCSQLSRLFLRNKGSVYKKEFVSLSVRERPRTNLEEDFIVMLGPVIKLV